MASEVLSLSVWPSRLLSFLASNFALRPKESEQENLLSSFPSPRFGSLSLAFRLKSDVEIICNTSLGTWA